MTDHRDDPTDATERPDPATAPDGGHPLTGPELDDAAQDLRSTAESIRVDIGRLAVIEDEKLALDPADPRVDAASDEAVVLADRIARETRAERELSRELG